MIARDALLASEFRVAPAYQLIEWMQLSGPEQQALASLPAGEKPYGILRPLKSEYPAKIAYQEVASLYLHCSGNSHLPSYFHSLSDDELYENIQLLLYESILEIKSGEEFLSGIAAADLFVKPSTDTTLLSHLSALSHFAIAYALNLRNIEMDELTGKLYAFNTCPALPDRFSELAADGAVRKLLEVDAQTDHAMLLKKDWWTSIDDDEKQTAWLYWQRKNLREFKFSDYPNYKLYLSPSIQHFKETFVKCIPVLNSSAAIAFKTGKDLSNLLRPDKFVVYFKSLEDLQSAVAMLVPVLSGIPAHGVPFTEQLDDAGLLSWGIDPPQHPGESVSWRSWITQQVARFISQSQSSPLNVKQKIKFVEQRLAMEGISAVTWKPVIPS
jgi:hypothetical protein